MIKLHSDGITFEVTNVDDAILLAQGLRKETPKPIKADDNLTLAPRRITKLRKHGKRKTCTVCNRQYLSASKNGKYCSKSCANRAYKQRVDDHNKLPSATIIAGQGVIKGTV